MEFIPLSSFHTLGIGAILAYWVVFERQKIVSFLDSWNYLIIIISLLVFTYNVIISQYPFLSEISLPIVTGSLVYQSYISYKGFAKRVFDIHFLQYLGKISYGIYLYHKPIPLLLIFSLAKIGIKLPPFLGVSICLVITILLAHFSWKLIEKPILKLKDNFDS